LAYEAKGVDTVCKRLWPKAPLLSLTELAPCAYFSIVNCEPVTVNSYTICYT